MSHCLLTYSLTTLCLLCVFVVLTSWFTQMGITVHTLTHTSRRNSSCCTQSFMKRDRSKWEWLLVLEVVSDAVRWSNRCSVWSILGPLVALHLKGMWLCTHCLVSTTEKKLRLSQTQQTPDCHYRPVTSQEAEILGVSGTTSLSCKVSHISDLIDRQTDRQTDVAQQGALQTVHRSPTRF